MPQVPQWHDATDFSISGDVITRMSIAIYSETPIGNLLAHQRQKFRVNTWDGSKVTMMYKSPLGGYLHPIAGLSRENPSPARGLNNVKKLST